MNKARIKYFLDFVPLFIILVLSVVSIGRWLTQTLILYGNIVLE